MSHKSCLSFSAIAITTEAFLEQQGIWRAWDTPHLLLYTTVEADREALHEVKASLTPSLEIAPLVIPMATLL